MGEENRGSSGSGTAMMVVAILGGILVVGCCGGVVAVGLGGSLLYTRSAPMDAVMQPPLTPMPVQTAPAANMPLDELNKNLEPLKTAPDESGIEKSEDASPLGSDPSEAQPVLGVPAGEETKE